MSARASAFSVSERAIPSAVTGGGEGGDGVGTLFTRLVILHSNWSPGSRDSSVGFECSAPLVVSPLFEPAGHRSLLAVDLGFQSEFPGPGSY